MRKSNHHISLSYGLRMKTIVFSSMATHDTPSKLLKNQKKRECFIDPDLYHFHKETINIKKLIAA